MKTALASILIAAACAGTADAGDRRLRQLWNEDPPAAPATAKTDPAVNPAVTDPANRKGTATAQSGSGKRPQQVAQQTKKKTQRPGDAPVEIADRTKTTPQGGQSGYPTPVGANATLVASNSSAEQPLILRYRLYKRTDASRVAVPVTEHFRSGDMIQLAVEANRPAFVYVVARGSTGKWQALLPSAQTTSDNRIEGRRSYFIPGSELTFRFDQQAGEERLFVVLSSEPIGDLDSLIYSLRDGGRNRAALLAKAIDDSVIAKVREVRARDLVIETVDDEPPAQTETAQDRHAVYVGSIQGGRVVADLVLIHE